MVLRDAAAFARLPAELQALADELASSGVLTVPGWMISLPNIVAPPDQNGDGYLITQHPCCHDPEPAFWGPGASRLGSTNEVHQVAGIIRRDIAQARQSSDEAEGQGAELTWPPSRRDFLLSGGCGGEARANW